MNYVGVDLHKETISVCVLSQAREKGQSRRFRCDDELKILEFFERHDQFGMLRFLDFILIIYLDENRDDFRIEFFTGIFHNRGFGFLDAQAFSEVPSRL